jgi:hypothetical protein
MFPESEVTRNKKEHDALHSRRRELSIQIDVGTDDLLEKVSHSIPRQRRFYWHRPFLTTYYDSPRRDLLKDGRTLCLVERLDTLRNIGIVNLKQRLKSSPPVLLRVEELWTIQLRSPLHLLALPQMSFFSSSQGNSPEEERHPLEKVAVCEQQRSKLVVLGPWTFTVIASFDVVRWKVANTLSLPKSFRVGFEINLETDTRPGAEGQARNILESLAGGICQQFDLEACSIPKAEGFLNTQANEHGIR